MTCPATGTVQDTDGNPTPVQCDLVAGHPDPRHYDQTTGVWWSS